MKKILLTGILLGLYKLAVSQTLYYADFKNLLRSNSIIDSSILVSKGFKLTRSEIIDNQKLTVYDKISNLKSETISIGTGFFQNNKKHYSMQYYSYDVLYMMDFIRQIPGDLKLTQKKDEDEDVFYQYENNDFIIDVFMTKNPVTKPYVIMMVDKLIDQF